jgi:pimeloyl-ACP methyl ester carboxylesterase
VLEANGLQFYVRDQGTGAPVILLHGFPDTGDLWRNQVPALADAGFRTIVPDLRGRGRSARPTEVAAYKLTELVKDVAGILDSLQIPRAHVVAHDWGAALAWGFAALMPARVDRLVALSVGAPGAIAKPSLEALQKGWYRMLIVHDPESEARLQRDDWFLLRALLDGAADTVAYLETLSEPGALTAGLNWYRANLTPESVIFGGRRLPPVQAPTLGIWSRGDRYLTEDAMLASEQCVAGAWRYAQFDGSHWIPIDQGERLNHLLLEFLPQPR